MDTTIKTVHLNIPQADMKLLKELARKMGWQIENQETEKLNHQNAPCQYTVEEMRTSVREAIEAFERGEGIPHSEIKRKTMPA